MSGTEPAVAARQSNPDLPVNLTTGYLDVPKEAVSLELPKLDKPFSLEQPRTILSETNKAREGVTSDL